MNKPNKSSKTAALIGAAAGVLNGLFGAGGGTVAVPLLAYVEEEQRRRQATSVVLIFVLSLFSTAMYGLKGRLDVDTALTFVPGGLVGAFIGARLLARIDNGLLKRIFGIIMIASAVRMLIG